MIRPALLASVFCLLCAACASGGDGADAMRQHRKEVAERTRGMRVATAQMPRGQALEGDALRAALIGRTWVKRYASFPNGRAGDYVLYRHFRDDGVLLFVDNWLSPSTDENRHDRWEVDGPRLCLLQHSLSETPGCYRVAQTADGAFQLYIDEPGAEYDQLLTSVITEVIDGPPPRVASVLKSPTD